MGCLIVLIGLLSARIALFFTWLFTNWIGRAFDTALVPILGFILLPWTTLVYVLVYQSGNRVNGFEWVLVGAGFLIDLSSDAGIGRLRRRGE